MEAALDCSGTAAAESLPEPHPGPDLQGNTVQGLPPPAQLPMPPPPLPPPVRPPQPPPPHQQQPPPQQPTHQLQGHHQEPPCQQPQQRQRSRPPHPHQVPPPPTQPQQQQLPPLPVQPQLRPPRRPGPQGPVNNRVGEVVDDEPDDDPERLRRIVARTIEQRAKLAAVERKASDLAASRALRRLEVARTVERQGLTADDLREFVGLGADFMWEAPLSRPAAIEHLDAMQSEALRPNSRQPQEDGQQAESNGVGGCDPSTGTLPGKASPAVYPTACVPGTSVASQQQLQLDDHQPGEPSIEHQASAWQPGESSSSTAEQFDIAATDRPAESFDIGSDESDGSEAQSGLSDADADDAYWLSELCSNGVGNIQPAVEEQNGSPSDDGDRPAKRHRPG